MDALQPGLGQRTYEAREGLQPFNAPNCYHDKSTERYAEPSSINDLTLGYAVLSDLADHMRTSVVGSCVDYRTWFRVEAGHKCDRWEIAESWCGEILADLRTSMGTAFFASDGDGLELLP